MKVGDLMTQQVRTCSPNDSMSTAAQIMWEADCGCVPVVDSDGRAIGIITDRDICMAAYTRGEPLTHIPVSVAASRNLFAVQADDSVDDVEGIMSKRKIRRVPVVDRDQHPIGIVSMNDLARRARPGARGVDSLNPENIVSTLGAICQPNGSRMAAAE